MPAIEQALHAILQSTHHGVAAWIYTTLLFIVVMPSILGFILGVVGARPKELAFGNLLKFWFTWFVLGPVMIPFKLIKYLVKEYQKGKKARAKARRQAQNNPPGNPPGNQGGVP